MNLLTNRQQSLIGLALAVLMLLTRGQHLSAVGFVPDASWAVFFLAGVYLRPVWALPAFMLLALLLDVAAVTWGGVSGFCMSPAYLLLVPAHAVLWGAGRFSRSGLLALGAALLGASIAAELLSSGGFYLLSGRFDDLSLAELGGRLFMYYPSSLEALALYAGMAALIHAAIVVALGWNPSGNGGGFLCRGKRR